VNNWYDLGFTHEDVAQVSDRLCDALFAWGDPETIAARVAEHFTAGADHVCVQVIRPTRDASDFTYLRGAWRDLAKVLIQQS
jgi:alkanesulfonate monooxygenase SsuD/methylene tetrahydromethanopterin reductase-like flavin-dependent oxidoreductase (luciferase family)